MPLSIPRPTTVSQTSAGTILPTNPATVDAERDSPLCLASGESFVTFQLDKGAGNTLLAFDFRTTDASGMLAFVAPESGSSDYVAVFLVAGKVFPHEHRFVIILCRLHLLSILEMA